MRKGLLLVLITLLSLLPLPILSPSVLPKAHGLTVAIDGTASNACTSSTTCTVTLSTTNIYDVIMLVTDIGSSSPSASDGNGLTWLRQSGLFDTATRFWLAKTQGVTLSSDVITITWGAAKTADVEAFGVTNLNYGEINDPSYSGSVKTSGSNSAPTGTATTTELATIIIGIVSNTTQATNLGAGAGFTEVPGITHTPDVEYKIVKSAQSASAVNWASGTLVSWAMYVEAFVMINDAGAPWTGTASPITIDTEAFFDSANRIPKTVIIHTTLANDLLLAYISNFANNAGTIVAIGASGNSPPASSWTQRTAPTDLGPQCIGLTSQLATMAEWWTITGNPGMYSLNITFGNAGSAQIRLIAINGVGATFLNDPTRSYTCQNYASGVDTSPFTVFSPPLQSGFAVAYVDGSDIGSGQTQCLLNQASNNYASPMSGFTAIPATLVSGSADFPGTEDGGMAEWSIINPGSALNQVTALCNSNKWWIVVDLLSYNPQIASPSSPASPPPFLATPLGFGLVFVFIGGVSWLVIRFTRERRTRLGLFRDTILV